MTRRLILALACEEGSADMEYFAMVVVAVMVIFFGYQLTNKWLGGAVIIELAICLAASTIVTKRIHSRLAGQARRRRKQVADQL